MKQIFLLLVIAVGLMTSCLGKLEDNAKVTDIVSVGQRLPDFTVTTSDSSLVSSGDLRGHASVIVFFSTHCKDCQRALPALQNVYNKYKARVTFVCISRAQSGNDVAAYWQAQGLNMPYSAQTDRSVYALPQQAYRVSMCQIITGLFVPFMSKRSMVIHCVERLMV